MTDEQKIFEISSTSSGLGGWSVQGKFLDCSMKASLERASAQDRLVHGIPNLPWPEDEGKAQGSLVGTIFDALVGEWLTTGANHSRDMFWWPEHGNLSLSHPLACQEAKRIFDAYIGHYKRDHLGEIIGSQLAIMIPKELTGLDEDLTGNIDFAVRRDGKIGIVDVKTNAAETSDLKMYFSLRHQLWIYAWGYELATGVKPDFCEADVTIKTKISKFNPDGPKFRKFTYGGLNEDRYRWLLQQFAEVKRKKANPMPEPKLSNCFPYSKPCPHYDDTRGLCSFS